MTSQYNKYEKHVIKILTMDNKGCDTRGIGKEETGGIMTVSICLLAIVWTVIVS